MPTFIIKTRKTTTMDYQFKEIEKKWQQYWNEHQIYQTKIDKAKPKYYVLDMFPYPSGAGLHVGHPLGYIASDIYARYKRLMGFNVLHPMGYDAYGLPAEQYAIQTGQHPAITTEKNIKRYREQLDKLGFSFDWSREVRTCDPKYYKWTQWTFIQLYNHYYDKDTDKATSIDSLIKKFNENGSNAVNAVCEEHVPFTPAQWNAYSEKEQQQLLMKYRLAYLADTLVNWCPQLGTVLANDEVKDGFSVRGGYPVERKLMKQWSLRITAYAERLLKGLDTIDWTDSLKEIQRNWIGKSEGAIIFFPIKGHKINMEIFTTRPDTIFGVTYMTFAPEHEYVMKITTPQYKQAVAQYVQQAKNKSERERMAEAKKISGQFTGAYAINPFTNEEIPIWISDYVLAGYGTGAVMAVPGHDSRDYAFAHHFSLPIKEVIKGGDLTIAAYEEKEGTLINSGFINGMHPKEAIKAIIAKLEEQKTGYGKINFRLRDAIFSRQRYWGEPFPVYYKDGSPYMMDESKLPLQLPEIDKYLPTETGEPPLARATNWKTEEGHPIECNTMPGFAGSSGYYLRYMDAANDKEYFSKEAIDYWQNVDLYIGGAEHATGHLIYARFWNKFLKDIGLGCQEEPFKKLINQGMIQGRSNFVYRIKGTKQFVSFNLKDKYDTSAINVDINIVKNDLLDIEAFKKWQPDYADATFILEDGKYICGWEIEKMSKSLFNVQNPDDLVEKYGADTLRMYEMFLGPLEQHKPWDTNGIEGVYRFIRKLWRLFFDASGNLSISDENPAPAELKILHKTIKKVQEDIERFAFNTSVSTFMVCVNELSDLKCNKRSILTDLLITISPFAPHIAEELWQLTGNKCSIVTAQFPKYNEDFIKENNFTYPVSINGKLRFKLELPIDLGQKEIENAVLQSPEAKKYLEGQNLKKVIIVPKKIVNIVI